MFSMCFAALDLEQGRALAWKHPGVPAVLAIAVFSDWRFAVRDVHVPTGAYVRDPCMALTLILSFS